MLHNEAYNKKYKQYNAKGQLKVKVNVKTETALKEVNDLLRNGELVLVIEVDQKPNMITFIAATEKKEVRFAVDKKEKMLDFLEQLIEILPPFHRYDIADLIEELKNEG